MREKVLLAVEMRWKLVLKEMEGLVEYFLRTAIYKSPSVDTRPHISATHPNAF